MNLGAIPRGGKQQAKALKRRRYDFRGKRERKLCASDGATTTIARDLAHADPVGVRARIGSPARYRRRHGVPRKEIGRAHVNSSHSQISYAVFCLKKKK